MIYMVPVNEIILRLLLGAVIGGIVGFEREIHGRAAGFRTQLIVCVASVLIMIISENYYFKIHTLDPTLRIDPARISAGALIGIGFLGAGVIIKSGFAIRGLTTAASIWIVSAIGLAVGAGLYFEGIATFIITITALMALRKIERKIKVLRYKIITVSTSLPGDRENTITSILLNHGFHIHSINYERNTTKSELVYSFTVSSRDKNAGRQLFSELGSMDFVNTLKISG
jgi:putative Mg2+ transporter-C (MgtC) family protein